MKIADLNKKAMKLGRERAAKIAEKRVIADSDEMMTPKARDEFVAAWTKEFDRQYEKAMTELRGEVQWTARNAREDAALARPTFDPNSAADLTRTEQAWRNVVLPQLEKGRNLAEVLRSADRDAVLGAERFAPAYLAANHKSAGEGLIPERPDHTAIVRSMASRRLAELVDDDRKSEAILAGDRVDTEVEAFEHIAQLTDRGGNNLEAAITAHYAAQPEPADSDDTAA
jgi:hypothetical protein